MTGYSSDDPLHAGTLWLAQTSQYWGNVLDDWMCGPPELAVAELPLGRRFDVVRCPIAGELARRLVGLLRATGRPVGPVLVGGCFTDVLVPVDTSGVPGLLDRHAAVFRCPIPGAVGHRLMTWLVPPDGSGVLTDPADLVAALTDVQAKRSR